MGSFLLGEGTLLVVAFVEVVGVVARDAEVAAEVKHVDGAEVAGDGNEGEGARCFGEDNSSADVDAIHDDPDIGGSAMDGSAGAGGGDEVLPAAEMVGGADGGDCVFVGDALVRKAHGVDADAIEFADDLAIGGFIVGNHAGGEAEQGSVEGEAFFHGGFGLQVLERGRCPLKWNGGERSDGGRRGVVGVLGVVRRWPGLLGSGNLGEGDEPTGEACKNGGTRNRRFPVHKGMNAGCWERLRWDLRGIFGGVGGSCFSNRRAEILAFPGLRIQTWGTPVYQQRKLLKNCETYEWFMN
jgi:hypothetical protein